MVWGSRTMDGARGGDRGHVVGSTGWTALVTPALVTPAWVLSPLASSRMRTHGLNGPREKPGLQRCIRQSRPSGQWISE